MSIHAMKWAKKQRAGGPGPKAVLINLAERANAHHECFPSQKTLAGELEMDERSVRRHVLVLVKRSLVETIRRHRKDGSRTSNGYVLLIKQPDTMSASQTDMLSGRNDVGNAETNRTDCPDGEEAYRTNTTGLPDKLSGLTSFEPEENRKNKAVSSLRSLPDASVGRLINNGKKTEGGSEKFGRFMPILRELNYRANATDASILKAALLHIGPDELEHAIRGLALLRDNGRLEIKPGEPLSMRVLHASSKPDKRHIWAAAVDAYIRHVEREQKPSATGPKRLHVQVS